MKTTAPEQFRVGFDPARRMGIPAMMASDASFGRNGLFCVPCERVILRCLISDGEGWEHVSVSLPNRCPTWAEMCFVKNLFWDESECVVQYHPRDEDYVNCHPYCLHLWKPTDCEIPTPPPVLVGIKS